MREKYANKLLVLLLFFGITFSFFIDSTVFASSFETLQNTHQRVFDDAGKLSDDEEAKLTEHFQEIMNREKVDVAYVLLGQDYPLYEEDLELFAEQMYQRGSFGSKTSGDAVFLMFSTSTRKYNMISFGSEKFKETLIKYKDKVVKVVIDEVKEGKDNYYQAGIQFATLSARYGKIGAFGKFMSLLFTWYMPTIAFVIAVIIIAVILSTHKGTIDVTERTYEKSGTYKISNREDRFKYRNVTKTKRQKSSSSSGGGGGGGGSSFGSGSY